MKLSFEIEGSASEPYIVLISREGANLQATCNCPAGSMRQYCKHRFRLFQGEKEGVVGGDIDKISIVPSLLIGTDVETAMLQVVEAEKETAEAKKRLSAAKKALARAMFD